MIIFKLHYFIFVKLIKKSTIVENLHTNTNKVLNIKFYFQLVDSLLKLTKLNVNC